MGNPTPSATLASQSFDENIATVPSDASAVQAPCGPPDVDDSATCANAAVRCSSYASASAHVTHRALLDSVIRSDMLSGHEHNIATIRRMPAHRALHRCIGVGGEDDGQMSSFDIRKRRAHALGTRISHSGCAEAVGTSGIGAWGSTTLLPQQCRLLKGQRQICGDES